MNPTNARVAQPLRKSVRPATTAVALAPVSATSEERFAERPLADWLTHWVTSIAGRRARPTTVETYQASIRRYLAPCIGHIPLAQLSAEHLEQLLQHMSDYGLSPSSCRRHYGILCRALRVAAQRGYVADNLPRLVEAPRNRPRRYAEPLTRDEARAVIDAAREGRNAPRWTMALALGLRQSEALALQWSDLDEAAGTLTIRRAVHRLAGVGLIYEEPKSARSRRTLVLPAPLLDQLKAHRVAQADERRRAGDRWEDNDLMFPLRSGRLINRRNDWAEWKRLLQSAGVREVRLHDARHTAASLLVAEGVHIRVLMELLGHSQIKTTLEVYAHVLPGLAQDAADKMAEALLS